MNEKDSNVISHEKDKKLKRIRLIIQLILLIILIGIAVFALIKLVPVFVKIQNDEVYRDYIVSEINKAGKFSWLILLGIQVVQAVLAFIPAGPCVIITGMMYNPVIATIICLVGQTIGAVIVIYLVKLFGYTFMALFIDPEHTKKFKLLDDAKRCGVLMFSYLLIPALPKDPIYFVVPFTKVKVRHFVIINLVARTPMTIVSVIFGNSLINGQIGLGLILGICCAVVALICFIFNKKIVDVIDRITSRTKTPQC